MIGEPFTFPKPGEPHGPALVALHQPPVVALLETAARWHAVDGCNDDECEPCNTFRLVWWDTYNTVDNYLGVALQAKLRATGCPLPPAPWEDATPDGTILPRPWER